MELSLTVDGQPVTLEAGELTLLDALREVVGARAPKDGCSPQGQCGCCTVLVDGVARVACVTPLRRMAGRSITTADGLDPEVSDRLVSAFIRAGASQCGFCTPGILVRLAPLGEHPSADAVERALLAHLCRCTGWKTIVAAATSAATATSTGAGTQASGARDWAAAGRRASIEGGVAQLVGADVVLGRGGFADDDHPVGALVAVPDPTAPDGWALGETLAEARAASGKIQGRRSGRDVTWPLEVPQGDWDITLQTTWVEPAYLEPDASWCQPGGEPHSPLANGGAFGGKAHSPAPGAARRLADRHGRPVRVVFSREDVVRLGPKRPPVAVGLRLDGSGLLRVVRTPGYAAALSASAPGLVVEEIEVPGPTTSLGLRGAGWVEGAVLAAAARLVAAEGVPTSGTAEVGVQAPSGGSARATVTLDGGGRPGAVSVSVRAGNPLDEVVLRSYCVGAAHMALGWVCSEAITVGDDGVVEDLTVRSFGVLRARDTPEVEVHIESSDDEAVNGSDAVFAAVAAATWLAKGLPAAWPTDRGGW